MSKSCVHSGAIVNQGGYTKKESESVKRKGGNVWYQKKKTKRVVVVGQSKRDPKNLWKEPVIPASVWRPCADQRNWKPSGETVCVCELALTECLCHYVMCISKWKEWADQQRVAICNAVVVARLVNASLVVPKVMYSSVWRDVSDIYWEEHFINYLNPAIRIVTDVDVPKESKPSFYLKNILPILFKNRAVHFLGFANRLAFDPIPFQLQRLRCKCNFHALLFVPKLQESGALLLRRLRKQAAYPGPLDRYLVGPHTDLIVNSELKAYVLWHLKKQCLCLLLLDLTLADVDFIGCTAADAFAMTDSGSQLSSLVSGYRIYHGAGKMPTIRTNMRRLSAIFMKKTTRVRNI
ncbi:hypothetical protein Ddye_019757 [Dipteronia dyeriana]|uniref:O-fucosyltransferase family protein n=1 Tax=Dipteronia dyeriana TaxID=168575 RepID=A0AAD9TZ03_9ROSI|nr:hypothetical protein Ddye_019757 [Dipteronia dyeriana]